MVNPTKKELFIEYSKRDNNMLDPMVIPNYGCVNKGSRGLRCQGSNYLDSEKWCLRCTNYDKRFSIIKEKKK